MSGSDLETDFRTFADAPNSSVEGGLIVSRLIRPDTDVQWVRGELGRLARQVDSSAVPEHLIDVLRRDGFIGAENYRDIGNSSLELVLRSHRGIPITLAIVIIGVAEHLGINATGINFPGHFMVRLDGDLFDPFAMQPIDTTGEEKWLEQSNLSAEEAFRPATPSDVVVRMLNNLVALAVSRGDPTGAIELTDYQLIVASQRFPVHINRADLWCMVGAVDMARHELEAALQLTPPTTLARKRVEDKLHELGNARPTLH